jgi:hypothetical protein
MHFLSNPDAGSSFLFYKTYYGACKEVNESYAASTSCIEITLEDPASSIVIP